MSRAIVTNEQALIQLRLSLAKAIDAVVQEQCENFADVWWIDSLNDRMAEAAVNVLRAVIDTQDWLRMEGCLAKDA